MATRAFRCVLGLSLVILLGFGMLADGQGGATAPGKPGPVVDSGRQAGVKLPLAFEANRGQADPAVKFLAHAGGETVFLTETESVLVFGKGASPDVVWLRLAAANPKPKVVGLDPLPGQTSYFVGNNPKAWRVGVPTYGRVAYQDMYPGVSLVYYGTAGQLEDDFVVAPGADPSAIALDVAGAQGLWTDQQGSLHLRLPRGEAVEHRPVIYQEIDGARHPVEGGYVMRGPRQVGFRVGAYDPNRPLVVDPVLTYSTYLGGGGSDQAYGVAVDSLGNIYVSGYTTSANFPTSGALQGTLAGGCNAFVSKLNPSGSALIYSTYLGGSNCDYAYNVAVDGAGDAYVVGSADSTNFPTKNALQPTNHGGSDAFVSKLNPSGSALIYSTYLGGDGSDYAQGVAVDRSGNAYVTGTTYSYDFPTARAMQRRNKSGSGTAFVAKLNPTGSALTYSTYLGGSDYEQGVGIAVDSAGDAYVAGTTGSHDFPTVNAVQPTDLSPGIGTGFVSELNPRGSGLVFSTFLGGSGVDAGYAIAVDGAGNVYVTGLTQSADFPTANPLQASKLGPETAFVTKLSPSGASFVYSTYLGGSGHDIGYGIAANGAGQASLTGYTDSSNFPVVKPIQSAKVAFADVFVSTLAADGSALTFSTYLGGSSYDDQGNAIAEDSAGNLYVAGYTKSTQFPLVSPLQPAYGGGQYDGFVVKIQP